MARRLEDCLEQNITRFTDDHPRTLYTFFVSEQLTFGRESVEPSSSVPFHEHPISEELLYCTSGNGVIYLGKGEGQQTLPFTSGTAVLVPKQTQHSIVNLSDTEQLWLTYTLTPPQTNKQFAATPVKTD